MITKDKEKKEPKYTPFKQVIVKEKKLTKMEHLIMFIKDPLTITAGVWVGVTLSDIDTYFKIVASLVVIVAGIYNLYISMKKNGHIK